MWILSLVAAASSYGCAPGSSSSGSSGGGSPSSGSPQQGSSGGGSASSGSSTGPSVSFAEAWGEGRIRDAAVAPGAGLVAIATSLGGGLYRLDGFERLWFHPTESWAVSAALSGDGSRVGIGSNDGKAVIRDSQSGAVVATLSGKGRMRIALSHDGARAAVSDDTPAVTLWDLSAPNQPVRTWPGPARGLSEVGFSPDGTRLAAADRAGTVTIWRLDGEHPARELKHGRQAVQALAFSPDGTRVASAGKEAIIWDLASGAQVQSIKAPGITRAVAWSQDGTRLVTGSDRSRAHVWSVADGTRLAEARVHQDKISAVAFGPNADTLVVASDKLNLSRLQPAPNAADGSVMTAVVERALPVSGSIGHIGFAPAPIAGAPGFVVTDRQLAVVRSMDGSPHCALDGHGSSMDGASFGPDGQSIITQAGDSVMVWALPAGTRRALISAAAHGLTRFWQAALSSDGKVLATAGEDDAARSFVIDLWDPATGARTRRLAELARRGLGGVQGLSFDRSGERVLIRLAGSAVVFAVSDGRELGRRDDIVGNPAGALWTSEGGRVLSALKPDGLVAWDPATGEQVTRFGGGPEGTIGVLAHSPDGSYLAAGVRTRDGDRVALWNLQTGALVHRNLPEPGRIVHTLGFSPSGALLAAGATAGQTDGRLVVWRSATAAPVQVTRQPAAPVRALGFSPDGRALVVGTGEGGLDYYRVTE